MREIKAPNFFDTGNINEEYLFLAGSIEMGTAEPWQQTVVDYLSNTGSHFVVLNPRRTDWDSSWVQSIDNQQFNEQVSWELNGLERADIILFYFDANTKSPITLLELGLTVGREKNIMVVCPPDFYRRGNVEILCKRYNIPLYDKLEEALRLI